MVGRDDDLAEIARVIDDPSVVRGIVITGPAGTGRTRLAREVLALAEDRDRVVHRAAATAATRGITLGALAHLLPVPRAGADRLALLQQSAAALAEPAEGRPLLVVDDAHLLDELSVALVHLLMVSGSVCVVLTVPTHDVPAWVGALGKDGMAVRIDLTDLARAEADALVSSFLGVDVDARTAEELWDLAGGNPQLLCELVRGGRHTGALRPVDGFWHWAGEITPTPSLVELALGRLGDPDAEQRLLVDVLATADTVPVEHLFALASREAVGELERRGLVTVTGGAARLTHPLLGLVVRSVQPESTARWIRAEAVRLADADEEQPTGERLRRVSELRLEAGGVPARPGQLADAAEQANAELDHVAAERLARAAIESGDPRAWLPLIEALQWQGRADEVERMCAGAARRGVSGRERTRLGLVRATNLFCGLRRRDAAERELRATAEAAVDAGDRAAVLATGALLALLAGRPDHAVELGEQALDGPVAARPVAAAAVAGGRGLQGDPDRALAVAAAGWAALESSPSGTPAAFARLALAQAEILILLLSGRVADLDRRARELHGVCMGAPEGAGDAVAALHCGWAALARGAVPRARYWLRQAEAGLRRSDPAGLLPLAASQLAITEGLTGNRERARDLLSETGAAVRVPLYEPLQMLAEGWVLAGEGKDGGSVALGSAAAAAAAGQPAVELIALHMAVRLGQADRTVRRLDELADELGGLHATTLAAHARAVVADDGPGLEHAAEGFAALGARLRAADALAQAARAYERVGDRRHAASAHARAETLALACEVHGTPALRELTPTRLTDREDEIALLAAHGMNNQAIAARLVLSVRTVEAHLAKVYVKLGIAGRHELSRTLVDRYRTVP